MFDPDCLTVSKAARESRAVYLDTVSLVLLSIQQPWYGMPRQLADVREHGRDSVYLFGAKRAGYDYARAFSGELQQAAREAYASGDLDSLIMRYLDVPCLGLAKASFLALLTVGNGACLDVHNLRALGLSPSIGIMAKTARDDTKARRISVYNSAWQSVGDASYWYNSWCDGLLERSHMHRFTSAQEVSAVHLLPLG